MEFTPPWTSESKIFIRSLKKIAKNALKCAVYIKNVSYDEASMRIAPNSITFTLILTKMLENV